MTRCEPGRHDEDRAFGDLLDGAQNVAGYTTERAARHSSDHDSTDQRSDGEWSDPPTRCQRRNRERSGHPGHGTGAG